MPAGAAEPGLAPRLVPQMLGEVLLQLLDPGGQSRAAGVGEVRLQ